MPDWEQIVDERLTGTGLDPEARREVVAELAAHLADCYEGLVEVGSPDPMGYTLAQVPDWKALGRNIRRSKEDAMSFPRKVLVPGLAALFLAQAVQMVLRHTPAPTWSPTLKFSWLLDAYTVAQFLIWLMLLPLAGGLGAWLSRRAGGGARQRLTAAVFPALYGVGLCAVAIVVTLLTGPGRLLLIPASEWWSFLMPWVLAPGLACVLGALPFLSGAPRKAEPAPPPSNAVSA